MEAPYTPSTSHLDEIAALQGHDISYHDVVRRNHNVQQAGVHLARLLSGFAEQGDFTPNAVLRSLVADYHHMAAGGLSTFEVGR